MQKNAVHVNVRNAKSWWSSCSVLAGNFIMQFAKQSMLKHVDVLWTLKFLLWVIVSDKLKLRQMQKAHRSQISDILTLHSTQIRGNVSWNCMHGDLETAEGLREPTTTWRTCWAAVWPTWGSVCNCTAVTVPWARDKGPSPYYKPTNVTCRLV